MNGLLSGPLSQKTNVNRGGGTTMITSASPTFKILACSTLDEGDSSSSSNGLPTSLEEFQTQLLAATSSIVENDDKPNPREELSDGPLCEFQRGFLDHLKPNALLKSTMKLAIQQGTMILSGFMSEQLEGDLKRNELVTEGKMSKQEAEEEAEEWEKAEWEKRWKTFPNKFLVALAKYHVITLVLRSYEYIASLVYSEETMDKLTMDYFAASKTMARKVDVPNEKVHAFARMTDCTFWANLLYYVADYSVYQAFFLYGYYVYYQRQKEQKKLLTRDEELELAKSCAISSSRLAASRSCGLIFSALGGGIGTVIRPGWGTLMLSTMAESAGLTVVDDGYGDAMSKFTGKTADSKKSD